MNHINSKVLLMLGAGTLAAVVAAGYFSGGRIPVSEATSSQSYALPALRAHLNDVAALTLTGAENKPLLTIARKESGWVVQDKSGYPADSGKVRELLLKLADASLLEEKTANAQRYAELGVEDVMSKDATGIRLQVEVPGKPAQLIVGKINSRGDGTFVRRPDEKQSWLAKGSLHLERQADNWLDKSLVDIGMQRIAEISLTRSDGKSLHLVKQQPTDAKFKLVDAPKGRTPVAEPDFNGPASVLTSLTLLDVSPAGNSTPQAGAPPVKARFRTFDGVVVDVDAWKKDDKHLARFTATLDTERAQAYIQSEQAPTKTNEAAKQQAKPAAGDAAKISTRKLAALTQEVNTLQGRFKDWVFVIPADKYAGMDKSVEDFLTPVAGKKK